MKFLLAMRKNAVTLPPEILKSKNYVRHYYKSKSYHS